MTGRRRSLVGAVALAVALLGRTPRACAETPTAGAAHDEARAEDGAARLRALGYVDTALDDPDRARRGVVRLVGDRTQTGWNLYCSVGSERAMFIDLRGSVVHELRVPAGGRGSDCLAEPYGENAFLILTEPYLALIGPDSRVIWRSERGHHHDFAVADDGAIYALTQKASRIAHQGRELPLRAEGVTVLEPDGTVRREIDLLGLFAARIPPTRLASMAALVEQGNECTPAYAGASNVLHANGIEWLRRPLGPGRRGHLLVSFREIDTIAIVDPEVPTVVWSWGPGVLDMPHHPSVLPNDRILVFDNGKHRGFSRLLEVDPVNARTTWEYRADLPESFFSPVRGSAEPLANGNVLVTESTRGRVFEVTRDKQVVWDFWNPETTPGGKRRQIYRMVRVARDPTKPTVSASGKVSDGGPAP